MLALSSRGQVASAGASVSSSGEWVIPPGLRGEKAEKETPASLVSICHRFQGTQCERWTLNFVGLEEKVGWVSPTC